MRRYILIIVLMLLAGCARTAGARRVDRMGPADAEHEFAAILFPTAGYRIPPKEKGKLDAEMLWLNSNRSAVVIVAGHADERGSDESNLRLGDMRAREVRSYLAQGGVRDAQLAEIVSYGERRPIDPVHSRAAWRKNRRVEITLR